MFHALAFSGRLSRQSFDHINEAGYVFVMIHIRLTLMFERRSEGRTQANQLEVRDGMRPAITDLRRSVRATLEALPA